MICIEPGCGKKTLNNLRKRCESCRQAAIDATSARHNERQKAQRLAYRANNPHRCINGCGAAVETRNSKCEPCKTNKRKTQKICRDKLKELEESLIVPDKPKPHKYSKTWRTAEQIDAEARKEDRRLAKVRGTLNPAMMAARNLPSWLVGVICD